MRDSTAQPLATSYSSITSPSFPLSMPSRHLIVDSLAFYLKLYYHPTSLLQRQSTTSMSAPSYWYYSRLLHQDAGRLWRCLAASIAANPTRPFHLSSVTPASDTLESTLDTRPPPRLLAPLLLARRSLPRPPARDLRQRAIVLLPQADPWPSDPVPSPSLLSHGLVAKHHEPSPRVEAPSPSPRWRSRSFALP